MSNYDVVVIGGGIVGAACAAELAGRGRRVALIERGRVASGTSAHCEGNLLVSDKGPGAELELSKLANAAWSKLAGTFRDELGGDFPDIEFEAKGGLVVATTEGEPPRSSTSLQLSAARTSPLSRSRWQRPASSSPGSPTA